MEMEGSGSSAFLIQVCVSRDGRNHSLTPRRRLFVFLACAFQSVRKLEWILCRISENIGKDIVLLLPFLFFAFSSSCVIGVINIMTWIAAVCRIENAGEEPGIDKDIKEIANFISSFPFLQFAQISGQVWAAEGATATTVIWFTGQGWSKWMLKARLGKMKMDVGTESKLTKRKIVKIRTNGRLSPRGCWWRGKQDVKGAGTC